MKLYINSATDISTIQAKIAKKEEDIRKKKQLIEKRNNAISKQLKILEKYLSSEEFDLLHSYINYVSEHGDWKLPEEYSIRDIRINHDAEFRQDFGFIDDPLYKIRDAVDSIYNSNRAIKEYKATLDKYNDQLSKIVQKEKEVDEVPAVLKDFMNQMVDAWDEYDYNIKDNGEAYLHELYAKQKEVLPDTSSKVRDEKMFELYPDYKAQYDKADEWHRMSIRHSMHKQFDWDYVEGPFKKKFGESVQYARNLWSKSKEEIHKANFEDGKRIILNLVNRVTKITGPITSWSGLYLTQGNRGTVLNGIVEGENGKAKVESILAGGYAIQKLHVRVLVHKVG